MQQTKVINCTLQAKLPTLASVKKKDFFKQNLINLKHHHHAVFVPVFKKLINRCLCVNGSSAHNIPLISVLHLEVLAPEHQQKNMGAIPCENVKNPDF